MDTQVGHAAVEGQEVGHGAPPGLDGLPAPDARRHPVRGERELVDVDPAVDLLIAPLLFRVPVTGAACDDAYLDTLTAAVEAAVRATA